MCAARARMRFAKSDLVLPLRCAENAFLEVLLSRFRLERHRDSEGLELSVAFSDATPATWNRAGRQALRARMPHFDQQAALYAAKLRELIFAQKGSVFSHNDPNFVFRWASAGTLPVLNIGRKEYYCLFFRDVFPIGWNIANGATDTAEELLNPLRALERELGEELVLFDPERKVRYVLRPDKDTILDRPEFAVFRKHWRDQFPDLDITRFRIAKLPLRWEKAPDRVNVRMGKRSETLENCFVNINAEDFGIEVDKIARITVNERLVLCDGEVTAHRSLNRPVGLFEVSRLQKELLTGNISFVPDRFYHSGVRRPGDRIIRFLNDVLKPEMESWRKKEDVDFFRRTKPRDRLRLCPVTESIIRRHAEQTPSRRGVTSKHHDVFLSYAVQDRRFAERLYRGLCSRGLSVFFAPRSDAPGAWNRAIHEELLTATAFVSVATKVEHLHRPWPQYETDAFHMVHLDDPRAQIIPVVKGFNPSLLPLPLRGHSAVIATRQTLERTLGDVMQLLRNARTNGPNRP